MVRGKFKPLIPFRSTTIGRAFVLNAMVLALIAALSIELRHYLDLRQETKGMSEVDKVFITIIGTFLLGLLIYSITRMIFGYGDGQIATVISGRLF